MERLSLGLLVSFGLQAGAANLPVFDKDFSCIDAGEASRYITELSVDAASFGGVELCDPKVDSEKLFNDLQLVEQGTFSGIGANLFIHDFVPLNSYYPWLVQQTRGIERG